LSKIILSLLFITSLFFVNCSVKKESQFNGKSSGESTYKEKKSDGFNKDEITIKTSDGIDLSANYFYQSEKKDISQPVIVLIHQFNQNKEQWSDSFIDSLVNNNYKVFAYDIRGHGKSSKVDYELSNLLTDPKLAPNDIIAVFGWLKKQQGIDTTKIGVLGTSIGGNLACYSKYFLGAACVVSVSNSKDGYFTFMGINEKAMGGMFVPKISKVLLICGKKDGPHAVDEQYLLDNYIDPPKDIKIYDSDKHGIFLNRENPEIYTFAINWFKKFL